MGWPTNYTYKTGEALMRGRQWRKHYHYMYAVIGKYYHHIGRSSKSGKSLSNEYLNRYKMSESTRPKIYMEINRKLHNKN